MKLTTTGTKLIDQYGRERIFNGINLVYKGEEEDGKRNYIYDYQPGTFTKLQANGINLIRLGIFWDGLEPGYGQYNEEYLNSIATVLDRCHANHISVFFDMHQDLYGTMFDGGAPEWATITDGAPHLSGDMWSDAYLFSDAVNTAFRNFWDNRETQYGVGLLDHYQQVWELVINRFKDHPAIIGYDFINEPFAGENSQLILGTLLSEYAKFRQLDIQPEKLIELFTDDQRKYELLVSLDDTELYSRVASSSSPLVQLFDQTKLADFYVKLTKMLRSITQEGLVLTENSYFSNMGIEAGTMPIMIENKLEALQVYAPHGYDLVVDSPLVVMSSNKRIEAILDAHKRVQQRLNIPVIFGEWGAHYKNSEALEHIEYVLNYFDRNKWSHTYYCWFESIEEYPISSKLSRPYPQAVAGVIEDYNFNFTSQEFNLNWIQNQQLVEPTVVYLPSRPERISLNGVYTLIEEHGYFIVHATSNDVEVKLNIKL